MLVQTYITGETSVNIARSIEDAVAAGRAAAGAQVPPVRVLAAHLRVSPATVSAAYRLNNTGDFVQVPTGAVHAFRNVGDAPARLLIINTPGHVHDGFFSEAGEPMQPGTRELPQRSGEVPDIPRLLDIGRRNGLEFLLPQEAAEAAVPDAVSD